MRSMHAKFMQRRTLGALPLSGKWSWGPNICAHASLAMTLTLSGKLYYVGPDTAVSCSFSWSKKHRHCAAVAVKGGHQIDLNVRDARVSTNHILMHNITLLQPGANS